MYAVCKTDIGQVRSSNQDICRCGTFSDGSAWTVVCDGMGGVNGGNIASSVACDAICKAITENYTPDMEEDAVRDIMLHAINDANAAVLHRAQEDPALNGMGTTVVVSIAAGGVLHIAHAGDSRCYWRKAGYDRPFLCAAACGKRRHHGGRGARAPAAQPHHARCGRAPRGGVRLRLL